MTAPADRAVVRKAAVSEADARLLATLAARLFEDAFGAMNTPEDLRLFLETTYSAALQFAELQDPNRVAWIAEAGVDRQPVGYAMARRNSLSQDVDAQNPAELQRIYSDRSWHGRGVGKALLDACIEQAREWGCDVLWLGVWERNPRGIAFYEKSGFRRVGAHRFLVGTDWQCDHVMALPLG